MPRIIADPVGESASAWASFEVALATALQGLKVGHIVEAVCVCHGEATVRFQRLAGPVLEATCVHDHGDNALDADAQLLLLEAGWMAGNVAADFVLRWQGDREGSNEQSGRSLRQRHRSYLPAEDFADAAAAGVRVLHVVKHLTQPPEITYSGLALARRLEKATKVIRQVDHLAREYKAERLRQAQPTVPSSHTLEDLTRLAQEAGLVAVLGNGRVVINGLDHATSAAFVLPGPGATEGIGFQMFFAEGVAESNVFHAWVSTRKLPPDQPTFVSVASGDGLWSLAYVEVGPWPQTVEEVHDRVSRVWHLAADSQEDLIRSGLLA